MMFLQLAARLFGGAFAVSVIVKRILGPIFVDLAGERLRGLPALAHRPRIEVCGVTGRRVH
jgi:hypothetical protein